MIKTFDYVERHTERARTESAEAMLPLHRNLARAVSALNPNLVSQLRLEEVKGWLEGTISETGGDCDLSGGEIWGLRLHLREVVSDDGTDMRWIKRAFIWTQMLEAASTTTSIGFRAEEAGDQLFSQALTGQVPYDVFQGNNVLFCSIGPAAQEALCAALRAERDFDPHQWDTDGYRVGR